MPVRTVQGDKCTFVSVFCHGKCAECEKMAGSCCGIGSSSWEARRGQHSPVVSQLTGLGEGEGEGSGGLTLGEGSGGSTEGEGSGGLGEGEGVASQVGSSTPAEALNAQHASMLAAPGRAGRSRAGKL